MMWRFIFTILTTALASSGFTAPGAAQAELPAGRGDAVVLHTEAPATEPDEGPNALDRGRYAVLIDLDENRLYFKQGDVTLWSAPVGTGTGMRLIAEEDDWDFSTPNGRFQVEFKEKDPVWIAPDWYFLENDLPVPAANHPSRYMRSTLGAAAIYISPSLAIHGTDRPELIGQRVSHGCIRLENRYALRLFHNVQVGTEVIIVGGDEVRENARVVDLREGYDPSLAVRTPRKPQAPDPLLERWKEMETLELIEELDEELTMGRTSSRWDEVAILLLERGMEGDERAVRGMLTKSSSLQSQRLEREWATFLAELYRAAPGTTLEVMSRLTSRQRDTTADLIVSASLTLYRGELDDAGVPWPSRRMPATRIPQLAERGWEALLAAEQVHREAHRAAASDADDQRGRRDSDELTRGSRPSAPERFSF